MKKILLYLTIIFTCVNLLGGDYSEKLFKNPPSEYRPGVLWDWMGGLISKDGITKDLEALSAKGVGEVMIMQMPDQCPYPYQWAYSDYDGKIKCLSDEWFNAINYAIGECDRLGMKFNMFSCPGWGHWGSPHVKPNMGIKKLVFVEVNVDGGKKISQKLSKPDIQIDQSGGNEIPEWNYAHTKKPKEKENFFKDMFVMAFPKTSKFKGSTSLDKVLDLTDKMDKDGNLVWDAPAGKWIVRRYCLVSENSINHPAPPDSMGLEADRMDPKAVQIVFDNIVGRIAKEAKSKGYKSFKSFETDSYESGFQDFSEDFEKEFKKRRGYDCRNWMPAWDWLPARLRITVGVRDLSVESKELSDRFRNDMLKTISELWVERFYGEMKKLADANGLKWVTEAYCKLPLDWTQVAAKSHNAGCEFWVRGDKISNFLGNAPEIAATYGNDRVWAESFTAWPYDSAWRLTPYNLKRAGDMAFANGVNYYYLHGFVHNPFSDDIKPGLTMGYWGTQFSRNLTWWGLSKAWFEYIARCQYMLHTGKQYFSALTYPTSYEASPTSKMTDYRSARLTDELLFGAKVINGKIVLPTGTEFGILYLNASPITPEALEKIKQLVVDGATLIANPPPRHSASLSNYPACDKKISALIDSMWGKNIDLKYHGEIKLGKGVIIYGTDLKNGLLHLDVLPDFICDKNEGKKIAIANVLRIDGSQKSWFLANMEDDITSTVCSFAVSGMQPELWNPVDGTVMKLTQYEFKNGRTIIPLKFYSRESYFIVFRDNASSSVGNGVNFPDMEIVKEIKSPWKLKFDSKWGGPSEEIIFDSLSDWSENNDLRIKYYSGIVEYKTTFNMPKIENNSLLYLNIGKVNNLARVKINGQDLGTIWCAPWQVEVPKNILKKENILEVEVVNTWVNRLIGDEQEPLDYEVVPIKRGKRATGYADGHDGRGLKDLPEWLLKNTPRPSKGRYTFSAWLYYDKDAPLQPSGLLGPIKILELKQ